MQRYMDPVRIPTRMLYVGSYMDRFVFTYSSLHGSYTVPRRKVYIDPHTKNHRRLGRLRVYTLHGTKDCSGKGVCSSSLD